MKSVSYENYKLFFKAFSNKTKFEIIKLLNEKPLSVNEIVKKSGFEQSRVSHNLKDLECCGFLKCKPKGKQKIYSLENKYMTSIIKNIFKYLKDYNKVLEMCNKTKRR